MGTFTKVGKPSRAERLGKVWVCRFCRCDGLRSEFHRIPRTDKHGGSRTVDVCLKCHEKGLDGRVKAGRKKRSSTSDDGNFYFSIESIPTHVGKKSSVSDWCDGTLLGFKQI